MSAVPQERRALTPAEVEEVLAGFSEADWARARGLARLRGDGLQGMQPDDLLQEAMVRLLDGTRVWQSDVRPMTVLARVMDSIANAQRKKIRRVNGDVAVVTTDVDEDDTRQQVMARDNETPDQVLEANELEHQLEAMCAEDADMESLLVTWLDDVRGAEAAAALQWDGKKHDAVRNKLTRRLVKYGIERR